MTTVARRTRSGAWLKILAMGAIGAVLYFAHAAFIPVALALLLSLALSGPVEALQRRGVSRSISAALILMAVLGLMTGVVVSLWSPAQAAYENAPKTIATIKKRLRPVVSTLHRLDDLRDTASTIASPANQAKPAVSVQPAALVEDSAPKLLLGVGVPVIAAAVTFAFVTLFLLTGGPPMLARMTAAFVDDLNASHVLGIIEKVRVEVGHFYLTTTLINVGLGAITTLAMWAWGMPTPYLWGALAALANYIPYAGAATTLAVVTVVAAVSFDDLSRVVGVTGTQLLIATLEGQLVQPLPVGRRLEVNPLLVFLGLWFGGLFWGIAGIVLATPVLVTLKVIAENSKSGKPLMDFLGPNEAGPRRRVLNTLLRSPRR
jgi:predicted PurR-regulated permease PerM